MLSIIIVADRVEDSLNLCLESVLAAVSGYPSEVFLVDIGSKQLETDALKLRFPWLKTVRNGPSGGSAASYNMAISLARGDFLLFLGADVEAGPGSFREMVRFLEKIETAGMVGPKIYGHDGDITCSCGCFPTLMNEARNCFGRTGAYKTNPVWDRHFFQGLDHFGMKRVDWVSGACFLVRRRALEQVGLFDEMFFPLGAEIDWCYRAREMGWLTYYHPTAIVTNKVSESRQDVSFCKNGHYRDVRGELWNKRLFFRKFYGSSQECVFRFMLYLSYSLQANFSPTYLERKSSPHEELRETGSSRP